QLAAYHLTPTIGETHNAVTQALKQQATQALAHLASLLDGAELDSYEVWEARHAWRGLIHQLLRLSSTFERLWQSSTMEFNRELLMPGFPILASELDRRFSETGRMLEGSPPERGPTSVPLRVDERIGSLSPFHRAEFLLYRSHLQEIDQLTRDLFETVADIHNFPRASVEPTYQAMPLLPSALDPERLASVARWFTALWLAWFIALYLPDIPDTVEFIVLTNSLSMVLCVTPQVSIVR